MLYVLTFFLLGPLLATDPDSGTVKRPVAPRALSSGQIIAEDDRRRSPTADELLEELQRSRPLNEVIPSSTAASGDNRASDRLLPEA